MYVGLWILALLLILFVILVVVVVATSENEDTKVIYFIIAITAFASFVVFIPPLPKVFNKEKGLHFWKHMSIYIVIVLFVIVYVGICWHEYYTTNQQNIKNGLLEQQKNMFVYPNV